MRCACPCLGCIGSCHLCCISCCTVSLCHFPNIHSIAEATAGNFVWNQGKQTILHQLWLHRLACGKIYCCHHGFQAKLLLNDVQTPRHGAHSSCSSHKVPSNPRVCRCGGGVSTRVCVLMKLKRRLELPRQGCLPQTSPSNPPLMLTTTRIATATWNLPLMQLSAGSCHTPLDFIVGS